MAWRLHDVVDPCEEDAGDWSIAAWVPARHKRPTVTSIAVLGVSWNIMIVVWIKLLVVV
jgi:hypothetical protein